jgi:hypothetical protein
MLVILGISASLLAYSISPSVRHAVGHAAHSVRHAMGNVFDHDRTPRHHAPPAPSKVAHPPVASRDGHAVGAP